MRGISLNPDQNSSQDLSISPLSYTAIYGKRYKLDQVLIDFSQAVSETVTITILSAAGTTYNHIIQSVILISETSFDYRPQGEANFQAGDKIQIQCTNANGIGVAHLTVKTSQLGSGG